ncbi:hypothetical protein VIGAN_07134100 [Vigna angularis var. angularis]|uniref:Uncharacterized protein n=1 Tax=Vigna angularis var. angularis TaxID=157739 RepID=A0A0S3SIG2_PHAAN|nr:hypothetical protein VIGAN_07134100 [Vigna angularis var. angularis]
MKWSYMYQSFFSSTLVSLTSFLGSSLILGFPCFGFMKQKQEQQGHWNKNFILDLRRIRLFLQLLFLCSIILCYLIPLTYAFSLGSKVHWIPLVSLSMNVVPALE